MAWIRRKALCLSVLMIVSVIHAADICELCRCFNYELDLAVMSCKGDEDFHPKINFEMFDWPKRKTEKVERKIQAFFSNLSIHLLPKYVDKKKTDKKRFGTNDLIVKYFFYRISGDSRVISLNFDDNLIRTLPSNPFEYFDNLESISVANNLITDLTKGEKW